MKLVFGNGLNVVGEFSWDTQTHPCVLQGDLCVVSQGRVCDFYTGERRGNMRRSGHGLVGRVALEMERWQMIADSVAFWALEPS